MNRLTYRQKFSLISLVLLAPLITTLILLHRILSADIAFTARELEGTRYARPLRQLIQHTLEQQFLAERYLSGESAIEAPLLAKQAEIVADLEELQRVDQELGLGLESSVAYVTMLNEWQRVKAQLLLRSLRDNAAAHSRVIEAVRLLLHRVGDQSKLIIDSDLDSYYLASATLLNLPDGLKLLSQLSGESDLIADPAAATDKVRFTVTFGLLQTNTIAVGGGIRVAIEENQGLQPVLEAPLRAFNNRLSELEATLNAVMVDSTPAPIFRQQLEGSIAANLALWDAAAAQLDDLLQRRIARLERQRSLTLGLSLLMVGLAGYLLGGFYRALMATVNGFQRSAERMTGGDFNQSTVVAGRDELARVASSFNSIAAALIASSAQREAIVEHAALGILTVGADGVVRTANPASARLFGRADLLGSSLEDLFDAPLASLQAAGSGREAIGTAADDRRFPAELAVGSIPNASEPLWIVFIRDVTLRREAENERNRLQEDIIRAQAVVLSKLSAPLIPISSEVMVMPLIGAIDAERMAGIVAALLEGIAANRTRALIIDVTGVPAVDAAVAQGLLQAGQGGRLLGARIVLTGIRPEAAQTFVELGMPLHTFETYSTLEQGIAAALDRPGGAHRR